MRRIDRKTTTHLCACHCLYTLVCVKMRAHCPYPCPCLRRAAHYVWSMRARSCACTQRTWLTDAQRRQWSAAAADSSGSLHQCSFSLVGAVQTGIPSALVRGGASGPRRASRNNYAWLYPSPCPPTQGITAPAEENLPFFKLLTEWRAQSAFWKHRGKTLLISLV